MTDDKEPHAEAAGAEPMVVTVLPMTAEWPIKFPVVWQSVRFEDGTTLRALVSTRANDPTNPDNDYCNAHITAFLYPAGADPTKTMGMGVLSMIILTRAKSWDFLYDELVTNDALDKTMDDLCVFLESFHGDRFSLDESASGMITVHEPAATTTPPVGPAKLSRRSLEAPNFYA